MIISFNLSQKKIVIYYIGYYTSEQIQHENRKKSPAAETKMEYVISSLSKVTSENIQIIAANDTNVKHVVKGSTTIIRKGISLKTFCSFSSGISLLRIVGRAIKKTQMCLYLLKNVHQGDRIIVYHSLAYKGLVRVLRLFKRCRITIEVEEIYADVIGSKRLRKKEMKYLQNADTYIFSSNLLNIEVNLTNKKYAIAHGTYGYSPSIAEKEKDGHIHVVYAGTFDSRKGGALAAIESAEFLPSIYHLHIMGFGTKLETQNVLTKIEEISKKTSATITYEGNLSGEQYICSIQKCEIGLSTQNPDEAFNATSFPSKILSYMSNGLRVVSARVPAVETSSLGKAVYYYDLQEPKEIANAIMSINLSENYDGRKIVKDLDDEFLMELSNIVS